MANASSGIAPPLPPAQGRQAALLALGQRYRAFLLSRHTLSTLANALLLVAGFVAHSAWPASRAAGGLWVASALVGGSPIFVLAARGILPGLALTANARAPTTGCPHTGRPT
ncbi:MAG TPA: hypothetical protein VLC52_03705 [Anaerolineae bacterium]|nr:hypothetical protein [Anaerolineae bacterium]